MALIIETMLRYYGYDVERAETAPDGIRMANLHRPDIVVTELELHEVMVKDLCAAIHQGSTDRAPVIIGFTSDPDDFAAIDRAAFHQVVRKPNFQLLVTTIETLNPSAKLPLQS